MRRSFSTISEKTEVTYCSPFQKWCSVFPHSYLSVENLITLAYLQAVFEVYMDFSNSYLLYNLALLCINELIVFACAGYGQVLWNSAGFKWQSYIEVCALQEWIVLLWWRPEDNVCLYVILLGNHIQTQWKLSLPSSKLDQRGQDFMKPQSAHNIVLNSICIGESDPRMTHCLLPTRKRREEDTMFVNRERGREKGLFFNSRQMCQHPVWLEKWITH